MIIREPFGQTTKPAIFVKQIIDTKNKQYGHTDGNVYITGSHPYNGEYQYITTKCVFQIGFHRFAHFDGDEFGRNIQNNNH